ncbi:hypothetical protein GH733_015812 [Mirounga leonina]|nr:hypothetical protein GH733_015812 [Mirounga leonina]
MAQFVFESDLHSPLQLDASIPNAPSARWQRKAKEAVGPLPHPCGQPTDPTALAGPQAELLANPAPRLRPLPANLGVTAISSIAMEVASFLRRRENQPEASQMPTKKEYQRAWALNLNGFDVEEANILRLCGKPQNAPEGYQNRLKVLYSQKATPGCHRKTCRYIPSPPDRILDAPEIRDDYPNLVDWSSRDFWLWRWTAACTCGIPGLVTSCSYCKRSSLGTRYPLWPGSKRAATWLSAEVQLREVQQKRLRNMTTHSARVSSLCWNSYISSSGSRSGHIHHHDVRVAEHHVATLSGHSQEVGGNDKLVNVWPSVPGEGGWVPLQTFTQHQGAVKAVAWCPWQSNVLATGGGTRDRHIRIWNVCSGACLSAVDAQSQVCSILWSPHYKELISGHGFAQNQLVIWKYPTMAKVAELKGHTARVLSLTMSPDGATVASAAADETLQLRCCFELDPARRWEREKASAAKSSLIHQGIH